MTATAAKSIPLKLPAQGQVRGGSIPSPADARARAPEWKMGKPKSLSSPLFIATRDILRYESNGRLLSVEEANMRPELIYAIDALEEELGALEHQAAELRNAINTLCRRAGIEPRYADASARSSGPSLTQIKPDTFYGKKMQTAAREFLELRKRAELGPAKPKEIFDALTAGGFQFDTKDETTALISLRGMLRKNSATFHKLPNGQYGLRGWYPNAKTPKSDDDDESETAKPKARKQAPKADRPVKASKVAASRPAADKARDEKGRKDLRPFILNELKDGKTHTHTAIAQRAVERGLDVGEGRSVIKAVNALLLGMRRRKITEKTSEGWKLVVTAQSEAA